MTSSIPTGAGGHYSFSAISSASRVILRVALPHSVDSTHFFECSDWCSPAKRINQNCGLCHCAGCTACASDEQDLQSCLTPAQVVSCSGARVVSRDPPTGEVELHVGADHKFTCSVAAAPGAKHAPPQLDCVDQNGELTTLPPLPITAVAASPPPLAESSREAEARQPSQQPVTATHAPDHSATKMPLAAPQSTYASTTQAASLPWVKWADECAHLLRSPAVVALSSASYSIAPSLEAPPAPRCEADLQLTVEYSNDGIGDWHDTLAVKSAPDGGVPTWHVANLRCSDPERLAGRQCLFFRVRPLQWSKSSASSLATAGLVLLPKASKASRLEAAFLLGHPAAVRLQSSVGQSHLQADITRILRLPEEDSLRIVEVREEPQSGRAWVIFDLLPTASRSANELTYQLASLLPLPRSEVYGGEVTQFMDRTAGLLQLDHANRTGIHRIVLPSSMEPLVKLPGATFETNLNVPSGGKSSKGSGIVMSLLVFASLLFVAAAAAIAMKMRSTGSSMSADALKEAASAVANDVNSVVEVFSNSVIERFTQRQWQIGGARHLKLPTTDDFGLEPLTSMFGSSSSSTRKFVIDDDVEQSFEPGLLPTPRIEPTEEPEPSYVLSSGTGEYADDMRTSAEDNEALQRARRLIAGMFDGGGSTQDADDGNTGAETTTTQVLVDEQLRPPVLDDEQVQDRTASLDVLVDAAPAPDVDAVLQRAKDLLATDAPSLLVDQPGELLQFPPAEEDVDAQPIDYGQVDDGETSLTLLRL